MYDPINITLIILYIQDLPKYCLEDPNVIVELDETLESDLCLLWDMSAEPDVAVFLFHHDILDLMKCVISQSCAPRLTVK